MYFFIDFPISACVYIYNSYIFLHIGTGKTTLGAHLAYVFAKLNREIKTNAKSEKNQCVVYCGSSNVSVDFVASKYVRACISVYLLY